jgi:tetratricopeptide (TPR) repeat protein
MATEDLTRALAAADESIRLDPDEPRHRLTRAQILGPLGRFAEASQEAERAVASSERRPHVKARALCLLGDIAASGPQPDYKRAVNYHTEAIKLADTIANDPHPDIRLPAKEVLVDAHLGAAQDIAWGSWNQKEASVSKWLQRAAAAADDLMVTEKGSSEYRFRVAARGLTAYVGLQGKLDPTELADEASRVGQELIGAATTSSAKQQAQWDLGMALYDAVQLYQMRKEHESALRFGQQAASFLEQGIGRRQNHPTDSYFLGRLYFRLGAIHAVGQQKNHRSAITWFDKASPLLEKAITKVDPAERGRLGETLVSMGVSYWEVGQRERSVDLTSRGITLMEQAVKEGTLERTSLEIPYGNLATMYRHLGKTEDANRYLEKASRNSNTIRR